MLYNNIYIQFDKYVLEGVQMNNFILNVILWTFALFGIIEIIRYIISAFKYTNLKSDGIYLIIAVKNKEDKIEGFLRSILFKFLYGKDDNFKEIIVTDLGSEDNTLKILDALQEDYKCIKVSNWKECKEIFDNISDT